MIIELSEAAAHEWLSTNRLSVYLRAARSDLSRALRLYEWNARMTAACMQDIGHLELLLRNRYDAALRQISGQVVANLTFGFWSALTKSEREATLWTPALAHWKPVFSQTTGLVRQLQHVDHVLFCLDPDIAAWVGERSEVLATLEDLPEPLIAGWPATYLQISKADGERRLLRAIDRLEGRSPVSRPC
ncbi:hypothetical protein [Subtercola sp. RTI3]|uniref:hypothetical protein n=1 Tax=Subtercola sp. RTI3 TaxID=3048639 RepID=UPI002B23A99C|nr:hypothetical protein [Subtercola sp. RTI3]MEA9984628.1 hypothetical protein [Subtercola sp. RTI3]